MLHLDEIPVPIFEQLPLSDLSDFEEDSDGNNADFEIQEDSFCKGFVQPELDGLARDLDLSKKVSEILASRLNEKNFLE